jgi:hypothetical protein
MIQSEEKRGVTAATFAIERPRNRAKDDFKERSRIAVLAGRGYRTQETSALDFKRWQATLEYCADQPSLVTEIILNSIVIRRACGDAY